MKNWLGLFFLIMFAIGTDTFLISPLLPTLREQFGVDVASSSWLMGAYALGYALFALIAGPLSDCWNRKKVLAYGMLGFAVATFLCGLASGFWSMLLFRGLAGICASVAAPQVWATIPIISPPQKVLKSMGIATAGLAVSQTLGVPIGTYMALQSWSMPFFILGAFSFVLAILTLAVVPNLPPAIQGPQPSIFGRYLALLQEGKAKPSFLAYFVFQTGNFGAFTFLGNWLADKFLMSVNQIGGVLIFLGLGNIIGSFFGSNVVKKIGRQASLTLGLGLMLIIYLFIAYSPSAVYVKAAYFSIFLLAGTVFPIMMAQLQSLSTTSRGTISALSSAVMYGATTLGAYLAGLLYAHVGGFQSVCLFTAVCYALSTVLWISSGVLTLEQPQTAAPQKAERS
jgi:predicted MFS family arabinose efflux permease